MTKLLNLNSLEKIDYEIVGLKCGLEIHQQLNTSKLFCSCPCEIVPISTLTKSITRKLRFTLSETGQVDSAAEDEFKKNKFNIYKYNDKTACLVELDEQPPKGPNTKALSMVIRTCQMMNVIIFNKIQFMRKLIIDGSVTTGFQRTALIGVGGYLNSSFGKVEIEGINLEEDSSRPIEQNDNHTIFALDRQAIPLIEITTGPQIKTANGALEIATQIGDILRSFKETKRGLGTIRQDLNVSIIGGSRIEIKGTQNLKLIPEIVDAEIRRQKIHLSIIEELKNRGINKDNFSDKNIYNITKIFEKTTSKVILSNLEEKESGVFAIKLNQFKSILGHELNNNFRFATEISDRNKSQFPQIKGLFHSDELPKYGIEQEDVNKIRKELKLENQDSFILIANKEKVAKNSLKYIFEIIDFLIQKVPSEVRQVDPKGTLTKYMRPMSGSARMYPETDIEDIIITEKYLKNESKNIPELFNLKLERLSKQFQVDKNNVEEILSKFTEQEYTQLLNIGLKSSQVYQTIFDLPKEVKKREKIEIFDFSFNLIKNILSALNENKLNKNFLFDLYSRLYKENRVDVENFEQYLEKNSFILEQVDLKQIEQEIKKIIEQNNKAPIGALMGLCMKNFQGKVEGKTISEILKRLVK